jgi:hypothetical protein
MTDPAPTSLLISHKRTQAARFEEHAVAIEQYAAQAHTPERAAELQAQANIAWRQVEQIRAEIASLEQGHDA